MIRIAALFLSISLLSGCVYSNVKLPLDRDVEQTQLGDKTGMSTMQSVLWSFAWGDASTYAAAKAGNIETINHLDLEQVVFLFGLYSKTTTIAYGN